MDWKLTILGNSSATPTLTRNPPAQVFHLKGINYLMDCGEGTQLQLLKFGINQNKIRYIFISHLHLDHFAGLIGFITTQNLRKRNADLHVYGPAGLEDIIKVQLHHSNAELHFRLYFHEIQAPDDNELFFENEDLTGYLFNLEHRIACYGFVFREKQKGLSISKEAIQADPPPKEAFPYLRVGMTYHAETGKSYTPDFYTIKPPAPRSYGYITDTLVQEKLVSYLSGLSVLYHEATFGEKFLETALSTYHTTAKQAGSLAKKAGVKKLLIGHFSARYHYLEQLLREARMVFPKTYLALQGETFSIE